MELPVDNVTQIHARYRHYKRLASQYHKTRKYAASRHWDGMAEGMKVALKLAGVDDSQLDHIFSRWPTDVIVGEI